MAQYTLLPTDTYNIEVEGATGRKFRYSYDAPGTLNLKQTLTETGFSGTEGIDYVILENIEFATDPGPEYRIGVRSGYWVIDQVYTPPILGFSGDEGVDWDVIEAHKLA
jgi:hypothetical protein